MPSIFSRIIARELPSYPVREDDRFYAFLDIYPVQPGHTLVVPKVEIDYFFDLPESILREIWVFSQPIADALRRVTGCLRVGAVVAGLEVPHAHLHLIPMNTEADLHLDHRVKGEPAALSAMAEALRKALQGGS